jgi:hypothetical protein
LLLFDLVRAGTEAHTERVSEIIFVVSTTIILPINREQHMLKNLCFVGITEV